MELLVAFLPLFRLFQLPFDWITVNILRAILLMEADCNFSNKILYGVRMIDNMRRFGLVPEDIYSEKIDWQMMEHWPKSCFLTWSDSSNYQLGLAQWMPPAAMTAWLMLLLAAPTFRDVGVPKEAV